MDTNATCTEIEGLLSLYVGGDLGSGQLELVEAHLAGCAACEDQAARSAMARRVLAETLVSVADGPGGAGGGEADLWPGIRAALVAEGCLGPRRADPSVPQPLPSVADHRQRLFARRLAAAAAAAAVLALALVGRGLFFGGEPRPLPLDRGLAAGPEAPLGSAPTMPDGALAGADLDAPSPTAAGQGSGLRPLGAGEWSLKDRSSSIAEEQGPVLVPVLVPQGDGGASLASGFTFQ